MQLSPCFDLQVASQVTTEHVCPPSGRSAALAQPPLVMALRAITKVNAIYGPVLLPLDRSGVQRTKGACDLATGLVLGPEAPSRLANKIWEHARSNNTQVSRGVVECATTILLFNLPQEG